MGWFPFLFYSSTYIAEIYTKEQSLNGTPLKQSDASLDPGAGVQDAAVRAGSFCLLVYSIVSLAASIILPIFVAPVTAPLSTNSSGPFANSRTMAGMDNIGQRRLSNWRQFTVPRWARPPIKGLTLPRLYTLSLALASLSWVSTLYVHDLYGSTILFSCCGIAWAVSMWAPFSIMGEVISQRIQEEQHLEQLRSHPQSEYVGGMDAIEIVYSKDGYFAVDDDEDEEIGMVEATSGRRYLPIKDRASQEEVVTASSSNTNVGRPAIATSDSFRNRVGTPSPTALEGPSQLGASESSGWSVQGKDYPHPGTDSATASDSEGGEGDSRHRYSIQNEDGRRLVSKRPRQQPSKSHNDGRNLPSGSQGLSSNGQRLYESNRHGTRYSTSVDGLGVPHPEALPQSQAALTSEGSSAGALLGIHNMYIVLPQFLVSFLSSVVFAAIEPRGKQEGAIDGPETTAVDPDTIGVVLRFGGIMAGIAALLSLRLWTQPRAAA